MTSEHGCASTAASRTYPSARVISVTHGVQHMVMLWTADLCGRHFTAAPVISESYCSLRAEERCDPKVQGTAGSRCQDLFLLESPEARSVSPSRTCDVCRGLPGARAGDSGLRPFCCGLGFNLYPTDTLYLCAPRFRLLERRLVTRAMLSPSGLASTELQTVLILRASSPNASKSLPCGQPF